MKITTMYPFSPNRIEAVDPKEKPWTHNPIVYDETASHPSYDCKEGDNVKLATRFALGPCGLPIFFAQLDI